MKSLSVLVSSLLPSLRKCSVFGGSAGAAALLLLLGGQPNALAQSDNFDSGSLSSAWVQYYASPALVSFSFPSVGSGKGLRIQANPIPSTLPAVAAIAQTNVYTDFYMAVDLVNWVVEDQAVVLIARWTPGGSFGLDGGSGIICNYDASQYGDGPTSRRQGQFQINEVFPGFGTHTLAVAEITLEPGRAYRLVFQGVGTIYTGKVYDLNDLSKPLVTIYADDAALYTSGLSGFLSFSRNGTAGTTDVTVDNYYAAASDPNTAIAPAIHHPLYTVDGTGVPEVVTRTPAKRFTNFHPPASGISFTAKTYTAGQVQANATRLYLNGVDASSSLAPFPVNGSTASFSTAPGTLVANKTYAARIEVQDTTGTLKSTNTFWFDTYSDAYVATLKTVECEDYNYSNGLYQLDPIPVSGLDTNGMVVNGSGVGYYDLSGTPEVDFSKPGGSYHIEFSEYRTADRAQITQGSTTTPARDEAGDIADNLTNMPPQRIHDTQRSKYVATNVWEYQVRLTSPGDWFNYTRVFEPTNYHVYLRCSSFGATTVYLDRVTSNPATTNQTTERLGAFDVDNHIMRLNYKYEPLMAGSFPAVLTLSGTNTLRLTMGGTVGQDERKVDLDYLMFEPTTDSPTVFYDFNGGNDTNPPPAWVHYDPIGGLTAPPATFTFPAGGYRIVAPAQMDPGCAAGAARAASVRPELYTDFYLSVDVLDWDDTQRQAFGLGARFENIALGTTTGYLFSWELGSGTLPNTNGGGTDISYLISEAPFGVTYPTNQSRSIHLEKGRHYRMTFLGQGTNFTGKIYDITDNPHPSVPLITTLGSDDKYFSGKVGLVAASQGSCSVGGDATFDNFLATTAEPNLAVSLGGGNVTLTWPLIPFRLEGSPSLSAPAWTTISGGILQSGNQNVYTVPATGMRYFRLVYP